MAGKIIDMSRIKQLLQLKRLGLSNRQIAKELKISRDKTNEYVRMAELDSLDIDALLRLDDPVLGLCGTALAQTCHQTTCMGGIQADASGRL